MHREKCKTIQNKLQNDQAFLIFSQPESFICGDTYHPYIQSPDFFYLTGSHHPDSALFISQQDIVFFTTPKDPLKELWDGTMLGLEGAKNLGFSEVYPISELEKVVIKKLEKKTALYCSLYQHKSWDEKLNVFLAAPLGRNHQKNITSLDSRLLTHPLRNIKNHATEIQQFTDVGHLTAKAYRNFLKILNSLETEAEVEAAFFSEAKKMGLDGFAYGPICAADSNSCVLHYRANNQKIKNFILIDIGFKKNYFNSDLTRTYPYRKKFNSLQEEIYNIVLECNTHIIETLEPGKDTLAALKMKAQSFFEKKLSKLPLKHSVQEYFPHGLGHSLGHEIHDVLTKDEPLTQGMMITIEPGLYFRFPDDPKELQGFGVRIEDNVIIQNSKALNLNSDAPKKLDEIYQLMNL